MLDKKGLQIFNNEEFGKVRAVMINGLPHFVGNDVASALEYSRPYEAVTAHCNGTVSHRVIDAIGREQDTKVVPIGDVLRLIVKAADQSKNPVIAEKAGRYESWIFDEVLPAIHQHGMYATPDTIERMLADPDAMIVTLQALKEARAERERLAAEVAKKDQIIGELKPKADYVDLILSSTGTMATTQIAADYGLSANKLNRILHDERVQHKVGDQWILYADHMGKGYTESITIPITRSNGRPDTKMHTKWTQKGRLMINDILNRHSIFANVDVEGRRGELALVSGNEEK